MRKTILTLLLVVACSATAFSWTSIQIYKWLPNSICDDVYGFASMVA